MHINRQMNIVVPLERGETTVYIHSTPISEDVFDNYWRVLAAAHARLFSEGLGVVSGPRVALRMVRDVAKERNVWDGPEGVQNGLMNEVRRLSNAFVPGATGWVTLPQQEAVSNGTLTAEESREAENILVFFTLVSLLNKKQQVPGLLKAAGDLWGFATTSLNSTDYAASLPILTAAATSGEKMAGSLVPH